MLDKKYDHLMVEKDKYDNWKKKEASEWWLATI